MTRNPPKPKIITDPAGEFVKTIERLSHRHSRYDIFTDFLTCAYCALRKPFEQNKKKADALEVEYMRVVKKHKDYPDTIKQFPQLLAFAVQAFDGGPGSGKDFLGRCAGSLEILNAGAGQFFTPYEISRMMAEMTLQDVGSIIEANGFVSIQEPACGAGGMIVAAADVIERAGFALNKTVYVDATDISEMCFKMAFIQCCMRGVPALVRHGNTLSGEVYDAAYTPAMYPFMLPKVTDRRIKDEKEKKTNADADRANSTGAPVLAGLAQLRGKWTQGDLFAGTNPGAPRADQKKTRRVAK